MDVTTVGGGLVLDTTNVLSFVLRKINWWERWRSADGDSNHHWVRRVVFFSLNGVLAPV